MVGGVGAASAVFAWLGEEEESDPGQVADSLLAFCATLVGGVEGLEDGYGDGANPCWWGVLLGEGGEFPAQPKVKLAQLVLPWVDGPHRCEYFPNVTKVLFHRTSLGGHPAGGQKAGAHTLGKELEERGGISNAFEVGWDSQPFAELAPLAPGG